MSGKREIGQDSFVAVVDSSLAKEYKLKKGQLLFVIGEGNVQVNEEDPYLFRKYFICVPCDKKGHVKSDGEKFGINGLNIKLVSKPRQERLFKQFIEDFGPAEEVDEGTT